MIRRNEEAAKLYEGIMKIIDYEKLPDRTWLPLFDAALGLRVVNSRYRTDADITDYTASRDLKRLSECGLLVPHGEKRSRTYAAANPIMELRTATRLKRPLEDPYDVIKRRRMADQEEARLPGF